MGKEKLDNKKLAILRQLIRENLKDCGIPKRDINYFLLSVFYVSWKGDQRLLGLYISQAVKCIKSAGYQVLIREINNKFEIIKKSSDEEVMVYKNKNPFVYKIVIKKVRREILSLLKKNEKIKKNP